MQKLTRSFWWIWNLSFGVITVYFLHDRMLAVITGGVCLWIAALLIQRANAPR